jgi:hypothetical protein
LSGFQPLHCLKEQDGLPAPALLEGAALHNPRKAKPKPSERPGSPHSKKQTPMHPNVNANLFSAHPKVLPRTILRSQSQPRPCHLSASFSVVPQTAQNQMGFSP